MKTEDSTAGPPDLQPTLIAPQSPKSFRHGLEARGGVQVLHCKGKLVHQYRGRHYEGPKLVAIVTQVLPVARRLVVDLSAVRAVDSAGLGELVMIHIWAEAAGFDLKLAGLNKTVRCLFELANVISLFDLYPSVREAVAAMHQKEVPLA